MTILSLLYIFCPIFILFHISSIRNFKRTVHAWLKYRIPHHSKYGMKNPATVVIQFCLKCLSHAINSLFGKKPANFYQPVSGLGVGFWLGLPQKKIGVFKQGGVFCTCSQYTYHLLQNMELIEYAITKSSFARSKGCNWKEHYLHKMGCESWCNNV